MGSSLPGLPSHKDLTVDNITENVIRVNSQSGNERMSYVLARLVHHLHDFARETRLSTEEWMAGLNFLRDTGRTCTDTRHEFIALSDILGLSILLDAINHPKPADNGTEGTLLGPFHTHDAEHHAHGESISHDENGEPVLVLCTVSDTHGKPINDVKIDIWESDSSGNYDVQYADREHPDGRAVMRSDINGHFPFKAILPVAYPAPDDGPVGAFLKKLKRHTWRPAHMHFIFEKQGYDHLVTSLFLRGDIYETSDAVFGVKESLLVDVQIVDTELAKEYNVELGSKLIKYDFVLVSNEEAEVLRTKNAAKALQSLGQGMKLVNGLPVPESKAI